MVNVLWGVYMKVKAYRSKWEDRRKKNGSGEDNGKTRKAGLRSDRKEIVMSGSGSALRRSRQMKGSLTVGSIKN